MSSESTNLCKIYLRFVYDVYIRAWRRAILLKFVSAIFSMKTPPFLRSRMSAADISYKIQQPVRLTIRSTGGRQRRGALSSLIFRKLLVTAVSGRSSGSPRTCWAFRVKTRKVERSSLSEDAGCDESRITKCSFTLVTARDRVPRKLRYAVIEDKGGFSSLRWHEIVHVGGEKHVQKMFKKIENRGLFYELVIQHFHRELL